MNKRKKAGDYRRFDIEKWLDDSGVPYRTQGKNIKAGWIGMESPFWPDPSWHLGVNLDSKAFFCWLSGKKGTALQLVKTIEKCSWSRARDIIERYSSRRRIGNRTEPRGSHVSTHETYADIKLPRGTREKLDPALRKYLKGRDFDPDRLQKDYEIMQTSRMGDFKYRVLVPIYMDGYMVNFTCRDYTGKQDPRYKHCPNEKAVVPMNSCIYNWDTVTDRTIFVEGVTDVWRMGEETSAVMSKTWTDDQIKLIAEKNLKRAVVMFDEDAAKRAEKMANILTSFVPEVKLITLTEGDPADFTDEEAEEIKWDVLYR